MAAASSSSSSKHHLSFMDPAWLQTYGLSRENILDYFYLSPFYDSTSNNQIIRAQRVNSDHLLNMIGLEYIHESNLYEPTLFIIKKQNRRSSHHVDVLEVFYVMEGIIYQSPSFIDLLMTKYSKINLYLHQSFNILLQNTQHIPGVQEGHQCLFHSTLRKQQIQQEQGRKSQQQYIKIREFPSIQSTVDDLELIVAELEGGKGQDTPS